MFGVEIGESDVEQKCLGSKSFNQALNGFISVRCTLGFRLVQSRYNDLGCYAPLWFRYFNLMNLNKNVSEVIRAGLRLLENEENNAIALKNAIQEGLDSPRVENIDFDKNLKY